MTHDEPDALSLAQRLSATLAANDLVEAAYRSADMALAGFVGRPTLWVVVGKRDDLALLWPHPLSPALLDAVRPGAVPLTEFEAVRRLGSVAAGPVPSTPQARQLPDPASSS